MTIGDRITATRKARGLSQTELAALLGVTRGTVNRWERGSRTPDDGTRKAIAEALGTTQAYLLGETDTPTPERLAENHKGWRGDLMIKQELGDIPRKNRIISVPILSRDLVACAGFGNGGMDQIFAHAEQSIDLPASILGTVSVDLDKQPYIVHVEGDSMEEAGIPDGCQAIVNPAEEIFDGDVALVCYGRESTVAVKWIYWGRNGDVELRSADLRYPPRQFARDEISRGDFRILGKIVWTLAMPKRGA